MSLNLNSLESAIAALERMVRAHQVYGDSIPEDLQEAIRTATIQDFEVAYEQAWKLAKRWIDANVSPAALSGGSRRELFRLAAQHGLIDDVDLWMRFHQARNESSHSYDNETAAEVRTSAEAFVREAQKLLAALKARND